MTRDVDNNTDLHTRTAKIDPAAATQYQLTVVANKLLPKEGRAGSVPQGRLGHLGRHLLGWQVYRPGPVGHAIQAQVLCDHNAVSGAPFSQNPVIAPLYASVGSRMLRTCVAYCQVRPKYLLLDHNPRTACQRCKDKKASAKFRRLTHLAMTRQQQKQPKHGLLCCQRPQNPFPSLLEVLKNVFWGSHGGTRGSVQPARAARN